MVSRMVRDHEAAGSSPATPTIVEACKLRVCKLLLVLCNKTQLILYPPFYPLWRKKLSNLPPPSAAISC